MRELFFDKDVLLPISGQEAPLGFDEDAVRQLEVWRVGVLGLGLDVGYLALLVLGLNAKVLELLRYYLFES